jgi:FMN phosphatase YigB (HAD superfamily)
VGAGGGVSSPGRADGTALDGVVEIIAKVRAERPLDKWFDVEIVSCDVGECKPEPRIYRRCLEGLGVPPALSLFVDDRIENVEAAAALGLRTMHFKGDDSVEELRQALGLGSAGAER